MASKIKLNEVVLQSPNGLVEKSISIGDDGVVKIDGKEKANKAQSSYISPILLNSWVNFGSPFENVGYFKDDFGFVHFKGMIKSGTTTDGTGLFQLPSGYFKSGVVTYIPVYSADALGGIIITSTGLVTIHQGSNVWLSLDNVSFYVGL